MITAFLSITRFFLSLYRVFLDYYVYWDPKYKESKRTFYLLSDDHWWEEGDTTVPEESILVEEWEKDGEKKCWLYYEGENINDYPIVDPFTMTKRAKKTWLWIGDTTTEVDLTKALEKYMIVGNEIKLDILLHLIQVRNDTRLVYIDPRTYDEVKFPAEGVIIEEDEDVPQSLHNS